MMTRDECDALVTDLERIGADVREVTQNKLTGGLEIRVWCPDPAHEGGITGSKLFREVVHAGLTPVLPKGALDHK